ATAGTDYTLTSGTLSFDATVASQTILVPITDDTLPEPSENFTLTLSNPTGATLGTIKTTKVTITDNDPGVAFSMPVYTFSETMPTAVIMVKRSGPKVGVVTVNYSASAGSAVDGVDFNSTTGQLVFQPADVSKTFGVHMINDTNDDGTKTVILQLTAVSPANVVIPPGQAILQILDNEPVFQFSMQVY